MLENEQLVDIATAAAWIERRTGRKPHVSTMGRWGTRGCRGVMLETVTAGHARYTSIEALSRFMQGTPPATVLLTGESTPTGETKSPRKNARAVAEFERRVFGQKPEKANRKRAAAAHA